MRDILPPPPATAPPIPPIALLHATAQHLGRPTIELERIWQAEAVPCLCGNVNCGGTRLRFTLAMHGVHVGNGNFSVEPVRAASIAAVQ